MKKKIRELREELSKPGRRWDHELDRLLLWEIMTEDMNRSGNRQGEDEVFSVSEVNGSNIDNPPARIDPHGYGGSNLLHQGTRWLGRNGQPARGPLKPRRPQQLCLADGCQRDVTYLHGHRRYCAEHRAERRAEKKLQTQRDRRAKAKAVASGDIMSGTFDLLRYELAPGIQLIVGVMKPEVGEARRRDVVVLTSDMHELLEQGGESAVSAFFAGVIQYLSEQSDTLPEPAMIGTEALDLLKVIQAEEQTKIVAI